MAIAGISKGSPLINWMFDMRVYDEETLKREGYLGMIYKYRPINKDTLDTLKENHLWFSAPSAFNDILDCQGPLASDASPEEVANYFVKDGWDRSHIEELLSKQTVPLADLLREHHGKPGFFDEYARVCCFSKRNDINLMWSHYADKHQGICLGFDVLKDLKTFPALPIEYIDRAEFAPLNNFRDPYALFRLVYTKSNDWKYEEEVRVCYPREGDKNLFSFKPESLTQIIFGNRTPEKDIEHVMKLVKQREIRLQRVEIDASSYNLKIVDLEALK